MNTNNEKEERDKNIFGNSTIEKDGKKKGIAACNSLPPLTKPDQNV